MSLYNTGLIEKKNRLLFIGVLDLVWLKSGHKQQIHNVINFMLFFLSKWYLKNNKKNVHRLISYWKTFILPGTIAVAFLLRHVLSIYSSFKYFISYAMKTILNFVHWELYLYICAASRYGHTSGHQIETVQNIEMHKSCYKAFLSFIYWNQLNRWIVVCAFVQQMNSRIDIHPLIFFVIILVNHT